MDRNSVDSARGWFVVFGSFWGNFMTYGFSCTIGIYYAVFLDVFNGNFAKTALISSLNIGMLCAVGPVGSWMVAKYGGRTTMFVGTLISSLGLVISSFASNIDTLCFTLGVVVGVGFGLSYFTLTVVTAVHFDKYRLIAIAIVHSGSNLGVITYPWIHQFNLNEYGWRGSLLLASAINLNGCVCAMFIKPVTKIHKEDEMNKLTATEQCFRSTTLFLNAGFFLLIINAFFAVFGLNIVYTHIVEYMNTLGFSSIQSNGVLMGIGISGLMGKLLLSSLGSHRYIDVLYLFIASYLFAGMAIVAIGFSKSYIGIVIATLIFAFFSSAAYGPLLAQSISVILGIENLNYGFGYTMIVNTAGYSLGAPCAGYLYDVTNNYSWSFYLGGGATILSALVVLPAKMFKAKDLTSEGLDIAI